MNPEIAFVGDVHGNLEALQGIVNRLRHEVGHVVFLGDYLNKGEHSAHVMRELIRLSDSGFATLLRGNHETAMLAALDSADLVAFLKMGGAMTIRSYAHGIVGPDVMAEFRESLPAEHIEAIRKMPEIYETDELVATHSPLDDSEKRFRISAHVPMGELPRIGKRAAQLDTGCGASGTGRLTALYWPTLGFIQVDSSGTPIPHGVHQR